MVTVFKRNEQLVLMQDNASPGDPCLIIPVDDGGLLLEFIGGLIRVFEDNEDCDVMAYFGKVEEGEA